MFYLAQFNVNVSRYECFVCGGTLVDDQTVITAGHCILDSIEFKYNGVSFTEPAWSNQYYPTNGSMYTVWLGAQDISNLDQPPTVQMSVADAFRVLF